MRDERETFDRRARVNTIVSETDVQLRVREGGIELVPLLCVAAKTVVSILPQVVLLQ